MEDGFFGFGEYEEAVKWRVGKKRFVCWGIVSYGVLREKRRCVRRIEGSYVYLDIFN